MYGKLLNYMKKILLEHPVPCLFFHPKVNSKYDYPLNEHWMLKK